MDRNQAWPGEAPTHLEGTSTHELFGNHSAAMSNSDLSGSGQFGNEFSGAKKPARRSRNALSCAECRRLKLKCSRIWPCTSCVKRKCANICPDDVLKEVRPSRSKEVGALQNRIRELESTLAARDGIPYSGHRTRPQSPTNGSSSIHDEASYQSYEPYNATATADNSQHPGIQDVAEVMGTLLLGDDGSSRYLGKSAANALFHEEGSDQDHASVGSVDDEDDLASTYSGRFQPGGFPMVSRGLDAEDFQAMLPPLAETQRLATAYYTNCAYMFEPVRRDTFDKYLIAAYDFNIPDPLPLEQLACVFMIIALGVSFDLEAEFRDPSSNKFHNIAQACLTNAKFLNVPSLASIQCLHLMSTWQLTTHSQTGAFRAWPLLGLAGRMVLSTGIHRDGSIWAIPDPHLTIRRQLFWELASYDRFQGLILGRPYMLNSKHFDTLMPEGGTENSGESIEYHRAKWQFSLLVGELCDECLSVGRPGYDTILLHDRKIRTFKENLPAWLRFDPQQEVAQSPPEPGSRAFRQMAQRHALVVMIHETLLFLHRVAFANAIENYSAEPLRSPWAQSVVSLCLEAARTLIGVTRSAVSNYPKLAARWWHIQIHCFGAATCLAAVCIKAPASALTRLAWAELCDAVHLLESQVPEGGHARDLAPRLKRLREQAQLKLDAYQQSVISSNYPSINNSFETSDGRTPGNANGNQSDSPHEEKPSEDDRLAVLGTATRVLESKLRQTPRNHNHGHRNTPFGNNRSSSNTSYPSSNTPNSGGALSSGGSVGYPYSGGYSPTGQAAQQSQVVSNSTSAGVNASQPSVPVYSAPTPTAPSQPFAMGRGAMPVNVGFVDQSLAELLAEVSSPGHEPNNGGLLQETEDDDTAMMYFNGNGATPVSGRSPEDNGTGDTNNPFSSFSFSTINTFKAPRNPVSTGTTSSLGASTELPSSLSSSTNNSPSLYTALPDAGVSPSSGLDFTGQAELGLQDATPGSGSFFSSISGLIGQSPPSGVSTYSGYNPDARRGSVHDGGLSSSEQASQYRGASSRGSQSYENNTMLMDGRRSVVSGAGGSGGGSGSASNAGLRNSLQGVIPQSQLQSSTQGRDRTQSAGTNLTSSTTAAMEDSYLDTAWMDYFPTPGVGLFPQTTGLLFGGSSGANTPSGGAQALNTASSAPSSAGLPYQMPMSGGGGVSSNSQGQAQGRMQYSAAQQQHQQHQQEQARQQHHHQQQQATQQQQQQQQQQRTLDPTGRFVSQAGPGSNGMNTYRVYDDLFGSNNSNNQY